MASLGSWLSISGYVLTIAGSLLLFLGTPADVGMGHIPHVSDDDAREFFFANQARAIARRARQTKWGFALLMIGMVLQFVGFIAASKMNTVVPPQVQPSSPQPVTTAGSMRPDVFVTAATVLFGFLFAGYWWALNRELGFKPGERHFKFGYALLLLSMAILSVFGILHPLRNIATYNTELVGAYRAAVVVIIGVLGTCLRSSDITVCSVDRSTRRGKSTCSFG